MIVYVWGPIRICDPRSNQSVREYIEHPELGKLIKKLGVQRVEG